LINSDEVTTWLPLLKKLKIKQVGPDLLQLIARVVETLKLVEFQTDKSYLKRDQKVDSMIQEFIRTGGITEPTSDNTNLVGRIIRSNSRTLQKVSDYKGNELSIRATMFSLNTKIEKVNLKMKSFHDRDLGLNMIVNWLHSLENQNALTDLSIFLIDPMPNKPENLRMPKLQTLYDMVMKIIKNNIRSLTKLELEVFGGLGFLSKAFRTGLAELLSSCTALKYLVFNISPDPYSDKRVSYSVPPGFRG